ncbi:YfhO family protein [Planococcus shenhongbingii]|uniref:YfhO family protein n=1 Tax=Planococcus shenhongbingii TaxID=3058398 RepID=UPI002620DD5F|nr:YfhO family protein [Planococcus sp. N016]WKA59493.1 YfhO family protein [Planococcus sp. N016]
MRRLLPYMLFGICCLLLSAAAHGIFLRELAANRFMAGPNDGLSQMLPFKHLLYHQYTAGEFFYSTLFGFGTGTYSELAYYFSTSIIFIITVAAVFLLESAGIIGSPDILFWAHAAVIINIIRLAAVLFIATFVFRYMKFRPVPAFLGACVYAFSNIYFRHATYWEFFADAYLWLLLLIFGAEKVFREKKGGWFMAAVAISMIDNFYFAYVNFLLIGIYILFRLFLPLEKSESPKKTAITKLLISGLIGAGISAVSFIPAVYAYLNNHRPPFSQDVNWLGFIDNILFTSAFIVLPAVFVLLVFALPLYREQKFRFFAFLVLFCILLHYSPKAASMFNGFSAPQYRWEYFMAFAAGGAVAAGFSNLSWLKLKHIAIAGGLALLSYALFALIDPNLGIERSILAVVIAVTLLLFFSYVWALHKKSRIGQSVVLLLLGTGIVASGYQFLLALMEQGRTVQFPLFLGVMGIALFTFVLFAQASRDAVYGKVAAVFIVLTLLFSVNGSEYVLLVIRGETQLVTKELITGPDYNDPEIFGLLDEIRKRETDPVYRIEWMEGIRNNTPIAMNYRGLSAYSSILNEQLLRFYLYDLEIDMARESVSRYATLGKRANLHSLLQGKYSILPLEDVNVPAGFEQVLASDNYAVYENRYPLPFVHGASAVYSEERLERMPILMREHALLTGVILKETEISSPLPPAPKKLSYAIENKNALLEDGILNVTGETGGVNLLLTEPVPSGSDLYVSFHLENQALDARFPLTVNSYRTSRKSNISVYKTFVDDLTIRVPADESIRIRMPKGTYNLTELEVFEEPYDVLRAAAMEKHPNQQVKWNGSRLEAQYLNETEAKYLAMPVPYEIGWTAEVNDKKVNVLEANYAFIAIPADIGLNKISLTYRPPHFYKSLLISLLFLIAGTLYTLKQKRL